MRRRSANREEGNRSGTEKDGAEVEERERESERARKQKERKKERKRERARESERAREREREKERREIGKYPASLSFFIEKGGLLRQ
jgi:hypothetical protein